VFRPDLLKGRAAFITGGGTGICRGIALAFAAHGCDVAIVSRKAEHLEPTAAEIRALGVRALALTGDVRDGAAVQAIVNDAASSFGRLDIVVNGAAGNFICAAEQLSPNGFGTVVDIDLKGTFNVSRAALPHLKTHGGSIVNISATLQYLATLGQVIMIDLMLAGDNVMVLGALAAGLPPKQRKQVLGYGIVIALVCLIGFALIATQLLHIVGLLFGYYISYAVGLMRWRFSVLRAKRLREAAQAGADEPAS